MSYIQVPPDGAGKKVYSKTNTVNGNQVESQGVIVTDPDNPLQAQRVDIRGQAYTRFAEGSPSLDAFGNLRVGEGSILGAYEYTNGDYADLFQDEEDGAGAVQFVADKSETVLQVGGASGDHSARTTNRWHFYQPGVGNVITQTLYLNDNGKAGNIRRWGYFCICDGLFWELNGTTLNVVQRNKREGVTTEDRVSRANWNGDKLDGTGPSGMTIDLTKSNYFWIDFAWLGVGVSRFGILSSDGSRWVCHTFDNPNSKVGPYMAKGSLPLRYENTNTSVTAGTSELHMICAAVYASSRIDYTFWRYSDIETPTAVTTLVTDTHLFSMRPKLVLESGLYNRVGIYPDYINVFVSGGPVKISILDDAVLSGASWVETEGVVEADYSSTVSGGSRFFSQYLAEGAHRIDLSEYYETNDEGYHVLADATGAYTFSLVARKLSGTTVTVLASLGYKELQ